MAALGGVGGKGKSPLQGSRVLVSDKRVTGYIQEWVPHSHGWAIPLQAIIHPNARRNGGRIFVDVQDVREVQEIKVGSNVDFVLYSDARGLGAGDVRNLDDGEDVNDSDVPLPTGWTRVWSDEHNRHYFWHQATKESSWDRPGATHSNGGGLADGWEKHKDAVSGEIYYWNSVTKESTWEVPKYGQPAQGDSHEVPQNGHHDDGHNDSPDDENLVSASGAPLLAVQRVRGRVAKWQGFCGWIEPHGDLGVDVQNIMEENQDKVYLNWREVPESLNLHVGDEVEFSVIADDNGLSAADVSLAADEAVQKQAKGKSRGKGKKSVDPMMRLERMWAKQDQQFGLEQQSAAAPADNQANREEREAAGNCPLLPGWEEIWCEEHKCPYYWHKASKTSSWDRPAMPSDAPPTNKKFWEGEGAKTGASYLATPMTPIGDGANKSITPITPTVSGASQKHAKPNAFAGALAPPLHGRPWTTPHHQSQQAPIPTTRRNNRPPIPAWGQSKRQRV